MTHQNPQEKMMLTIGDLNLAVTAPTRGLFDGIRSIGPGGAARGVLHQFDLTIESCSHLPAKPDSEVTTTDRGQFACADGVVFWQYYDESLAIIDCTGHRGRVYIKADKGEEHFRNFTLVYVLSLILAGYGLYLVHMAVVRKGSTLCCIIGTSGAGKSTLAGQLAAVGWDMLADDKAVVTVSHLLTPFSVSPVLLDMNQFSRCLVFPEKSNREQFSEPGRAGCHLSPALAVEKLCRSSLLPNSDSILRAGFECLTGLAAVSRVFKLEYIDGTICNGNGLTDLLERQGP